MLIFLADVFRVYGFYISVAASTFELLLTYFLKNSGSSLPLGSSINEADMSNRSTISLWLF
jgi:hypothetical protein